MEFEQVACVHIDVKFVSTNHVPCRCNNKLCHNDDIECVHQQRNPKQWVSGIMPTAAREQKRRGSAPVGFGEAGRLPQPGRQIVGAKTEDKPPTAKAE